MFKLGLAGAGRMGRNHIRAVAASSQVLIAAIAEPMEPAREALGRLDATVYPDLDSMLAAGGLDAVLVCVPSDFHLDTVKRLVAAGMPILCEKPVGVTAADARAAAELTTPAGLPFQVGFWRRFVPSLKRLRERIAAGELGDIYLVACFQWDGQPPSAYFRTHSGGIFIDMGVHEFDQTRWLTGQEFGAISSLFCGVAESLAGRSRKCPGDWRALRRHHRHGVAGAALPPGGRVQGGGLRHEGCGRGPIPVASDRR